LRLALRGRAGRRLVLVLAPRLRVDVDDVEVLGETVHERGDARGAGEHGAHCLKARSVLMTVEAVSCLRLMML
jgi:hypothetical protein